MTTIRAEILADSIHPYTHSRLTTMRLTYPRWIHAEFMTHRLFARNASSSRAIPSARLRAMIRADMAVPLRWGENKPGMQAGADLPRWREVLGRALWSALGRAALLTSAALDRLGIHKQIVNRIVEPWSHITVICTGTDTAFANFYMLRRDAAAEPTIQALAEEMAAVHRASVPARVQVFEWHLPLVDDAERTVKPYNADDMVRRSVARVARTSYLKPDGTKPTHAEDVALYMRLVGADPKHASPAEHQACAVSIGSGCFGTSSGWRQHRSEIVGECSTTPLVIAYDQR